jgi:putative PIN family toxin of toxin-antitoxin system
VTIVFDSGVLISALHFRGTPLDALRISFIRASVAHCVEIDDEVRKILALKFKWPQPNIEAALNGFAKDARLIKITGTLTGICRDPKDDMILECASLATADFIVSGDRDLLTLDEYAGISIVTPRTILDILGGA